MIDTHGRYGRTNKKMISLTDEGREQLQQFADAHGMSFSAAIESLALIGMNADLSKLLIPLLKETVDKALRRSFNRLAKLSLLGAAEAAVTHDLVTILLLQLIRQEAVAHPADFEEAMLVSYDAQDQPDARIRALFQEMRQLARQRQQRLLKKPLSDLVAQFTETGDARAPILDKEADDA